MMIALPALAVAFAAFCVWLTVRIINRREPWAVGVPFVLFIAFLFLVVPNLRRGRGGGQDVNKVKIKAVEDALEMYALDHDGHFPSTAQGLDVLWLRSDADEAWKGPYIKSSKGTLLDIWGTRLLYDGPPTGSESIPPKVWSAGPDKVPHTSDDVHLW